MKLAYAGFRFIEAYQIYYIAMDTRIILREKNKKLCHDCILEN